MLFGFREWSRTCNQTVYRDYTHKTTGKSEILQKLVEMYDGITKILNYDEDKKRIELERKYKKKYGIDYKRN